MSTIPTPTRSPLPSYPLASPKRKSMSITQTYYLAHSARGKLSNEAARSDHRLRHLVGHANLLDSLMLELADAEAEQESWFNASVRGARKTDRHIQWADSVVEEPEADWRAEDAESDSSDSSSDEDEDEEMQSAGFASLQRVQSHPTFEHMEVHIDEEEDDEDIYEDDGEEDYAMLTLSRTSSHPHSPPELSLDFEDDSSSSEDESMPPSPPADVLHSFPTSPKEPSTRISPTDQAAFFDEGFYLPQRSPARLVSAVSVY